MRTEKILKTTMLRNTLRQKIFPIVTMTSYTVFQVLDSKNTNYQNFKKRFAITI